MDQLQNAACRIRPATAADAPALLAIYRPYVEHTAVTFEYEVPSVEEFARRIETISSFYPYLVWEEDGAILGYAYATRLKERAAYQWNVELSVYLPQNVCRTGIGTALYSALIELLLLQGVQNFYGCVTMPNAASDALHRKLGFSLANVWHHCGYKLGQWHDVAWYEMTVAITEMPHPLRSIHAVSDHRVTAVLEKYGCKNSV